jgi:integrase/recombinase XerD
MGKLVERYAIPKEQWRDIWNQIGNRSGKFAVWMMFTYGLRVGEVANLKISDFDFQRKRLIVSFKINWKTKNRHERSLPLTDKKIKIIKTYLHNRPTDLDHDYVIYSVKRKHPVTVRTIQRWLNPIHPITAHWMRYSFAYDMYKRTGNNIKLVSKLLGHANVSTTSDYLERSQELLLEEARAFM